MNAEKKPVRAEIVEAKSLKDVTDDCRSHASVEDLSPLSLVPMMLSNILQALFGTLNNVYLGQLIGVNALAAVSVFFPILFFLISFIIGLGAALVGADRPGLGRLPPRHRQDRGGNRVSAWRCSAASRSRCSAACSRHI